MKALQLKSEENCKKYLDDITNIQHANEQLQKHVMTNNKEIKKGNDNITQLLMNINQLKEKLNNKNNIIKTQENVIHTLKQQHIEQLDKQNETNSKLTNLTTVNENLENEIKLLKQKLSDAIDKVEQQDNALKYMHQTMDEQLLYGGGLGVGFNGIGIHSDGNGDQHTHSIPAGMGLYTGSGVMTLTNMSAGHDGSSSPNSITKQTSPARQHSNEQNMKNRVQMKQTTSAFLEKYGKQNQDRVLEHPPQDWNEHASIVSHGNSTGGNKAHATPDMLTNIALVTPDVIDSTHATNQSNNISTVPTSYIKKNITYPVSSSMSSQQSSDLSTNTDMILNKVNETDLLSKIGIDYHDYQKHTGYNEVESDEEEDDDMNALLYYKTTI